MRLVEQGVIDLDRPVQAYLTEPLAAKHGKAWHEDLSDLAGDHPAVEDHRADEFQPVLLMSNSANAEGIFDELLRVTIADRYAPLEWEGHVPYARRGAPAR